MERLRRIPLAVIGVGLAIVVHGVDLWLYYTRRPGPYRG